MTGRAPKCLSFKDFNTYILFPGLKAGIPASQDINQMVPFGGAAFLVLASLDLGTYSEMYDDLHISHCVRVAPDSTISISEFLLIN